MGVREEENPLLLSGLEADTQQHQQVHLSSGVSSSTIKEIWLESKKFWQIAGPSIFSRLAMFSMTVITQSFAGHLGDLNLASFSIATTLIISISFGFLLGMASALETLCGRAYGAKQYHLLGIYMQRCWIVLFLCSILLLPLFVFATPILKLIGQPADTAEQTGLVAIWLIPFHFSFPFQFTLQRFLQSQLKTGVVALVSGGALLIHVILSWVFVYKLRVGIVGTALTLDFSWWVSVFGMFIYCVCGGCQLSWTGFSTQAFTGVWEFFKLSVASGIMLLLENIYYRVLIMVSGFVYNTKVAVDALSICVTILGWESMIPLGFLAATGVRVSNELGAGNAKGAKFATIVSLLTSLAVGLLFWSIVIAFPEKLAKIFTSSSFVFLMVNELAISLAVGLLFWSIVIAFPEKLAKIFTSSSFVFLMVNELAILLAFTILLNCIQPVLSGVAIGSGWQALVAYINIGSYYIVGVPLGVFLGWLLHFGIKGLWVGMICGTVVQTLVLSMVTMKCEWEREAEKAQIHITNEAAST